MKGLKLGQSLSLPLDAVTQAIGVLAKRRVGKSYTARRFAEQLFQAHQQIVIVDPKGDWWGIRSAADGKTPGLAVVILGGEHGDIPLEASGGELVAQLVTEQRVSVLLDLSQFRKRELAHFMTDFLESLYRLKAKEALRTPLMLIIDEADAIAPQVPQKGEERMLGAAEDIVRRGGQRGIGCTMITQRTAVLNKNVLTQCEMLIALRTIAPQDLKAMQAWIDVHGSAEERDQLITSLPSLPVGEAWFWSPGWPTADGIFQRVKVLPIETFDSGKTPVSGEKRIEPKRLADVDLVSLSQQMAETIAKVAADDPKQLRARIAELERDHIRLTKGRGAEAPNPPAKVERIEVPVLKDAQLTRIESLVEHLGGVQQKLAGEIQLLAKSLELIGMAAAAPTRDMTTPVGRVTPRGTTPSRKMPSGIDRAPATSGGHALTGAEQRILNAILELDQVGVDTPDRTLVGFMAGYTNLASKGFSNSMGSLSGAGLITYPAKKLIALTDSGRALAEAREPLASNHELHERLIQLLGPVYRRLLEPLVHIYPKAMERAALGDAAGYGNLASKGFANTIGRLSGLGFISYPAKGMVAATPMLFPFGGGR